MHVVRVLKAGAVAVLDRIALVREDILTRSAVWPISFMRKRGMTSIGVVALLLERLLPWKRIPRPVSNHGEVTWAKG